MNADAPAVDAAWKVVARSVRRTVRRTRNRWRAASPILLYHRVAEGFSDPWSLCVSPANFREHMAVLAARGVRPLDALVDDVADERPRRAPVVTFDDGYADFAEAALPCLRAYGIPATLFVVSGALDGARELWWDDLERIVLVPETLPASLALDLDGIPFAWRFEIDGDRRALYHALHRRIGRLAGAARMELLEALARWAGVAAGCRPTHRALDAATLAAVARDPRVTIGAHTVSHSYLGALSADEQQHEIVDAKRTLESIVRAPVRHFSYPHGDHEPETIACVRAAGFEAACGTDAEPVVGPVDRFDLPRIEVPNFGGAAFARWLEEWGG
jgi:peptidoglycan/xylan/chitin deacetylase (PgdA/CDA1 family)